MRILLATTHSYLPDIVHGSTKSIHELCVQLNQRGISAGVLCGGFSGNDNKKVMVQRRDYGGYPVYRANFVVRAVNWVIKDFQPDLVVVQVGAIFPLTNAILQAGIPVMVYFRDIEFRDHHGMFMPHERICYVANTRFTADRFKALLGLDCKILPPPLKREDYETDTTREQVLFIGSHPFKGIELAIRMAEECQHIPFMFVESWEVPEVWKQYYKSRVLKNKNSTWSAPVHNMLDIYSRASVLLVPSVWEETNGRVVTEAQLSGIPVLASDRGGLPDTVGPGGHVLPVHSPLETWITTLERMLNDKEEYEKLSENAKKHAWRPELDPSSIMDKFIEITGEFLSALK